MAHAMSATEWEQIRQAAIGLASTSPHSVSHWEHSLRMLAMRDEFDAGKEREGRIRLALAMAPPKTTSGQRLLALPWVMPRKRPWYALASCEALASRDPR